MKCGRFRMLSYCVQRSMMLPLPSKTTMQFSHCASTPSLPPPAAQAFMPSLGSWPVPPAPGGEETVASRHGSRPTGNLMLGPISESVLVSGRLMFGKLAAEQRIDAVGALGEDRLARAIGPFLVAGNRADVLGPALHDLVGAEDVLAADLAWDRGVGHALRGLDGRGGGGGHQADHAPGQTRGDGQSNTAHGFPPLWLAGR